MTRAEIIAELRRSAREDAAPYWDVADDAFYATREWRERQEAVCGLDDGARRALFLIVAHALEDEC